MTRIQHCEGCNPPGVKPTSQEEYEYILASAYALKKGFHSAESLDNVYSGLYAPDFISSIAMGLQDPSFRYHLQPIADDIEDDFELPPITTFSMIFRNPDDPDNFIQVWTDAD